MATSVVGQGKFKPRISPSLQERLQLFILSHIEQQNDMLSRRVHTSTERAHKLQLNGRETQNLTWDGKSIGPL